MLSREALVAQELHEAAESGNNARVKELLPELGAEQDTWLRGALMRAVYENQVRVVVVLLDANAPIDTVDTLGQTPLHWSARRGFEGLVRLLLQRKVDVGCRNPEGVTPLHLAVEYNAGPVVQLLMQHRADALVTAQDGRTPLHVAADAGASVAVAVLLDAKLEGSGQSSPSADAAATLLEVETNRGETALVRAAARGRATVVQLLLRAKADPEHKNLWGQSGLYLASLGGHVGSAAVLLDASAAVSAAAGDGSTPLHTAVDREHTQVVELLLSHKANTAAKAKGGRTPLHVAAERGCLEAAEALLANAAVVDARAEEDRTPLCCAATRGHAEVAQRLLEMEADPQGLDALKQTPLHAAASAGRVKVADLLIARRVRVEQEDAGGRTPMLLALAFKQDAMIRLLLKRGGVLPEDVASLPEMQPLINEVENEVLQEQLNEVNAGKLREQMKGAERDFEEARQTMLSLCTKSVTATTAPVLAHNESMLVAAKEQVRVHQLAERRYVEQIKISERSVADTAAEIKSQRRTLELLRKAVEDLRNGRGRKVEEANRLVKDIAECRKQELAAQEQEVKTAEQLKEAREKAAALRERLLGLTGEGDELTERLETVQAQLEKWRQEKEAAVELHAQAQALLKPAMPKSLPKPGSAQRTSG